VRAVVSADSERPMDRSQALYTLNIYMSSVKVSNSTHKRAINQPQERLSGYVVSACCKDKPSAVCPLRGSLHLWRWCEKWPTWPISSKNCLHTCLHTRAKPGQITQCNDWTFFLQPTEFWLNHDFYTHCDWKSYECGTLFASWRGSSSNFVLWCPTRFQALIVSNWERDRTTFTSKRCPIGRRDYWSVDQKFDIFELAIFAYNSYNSNR